MSQIGDAFLEGHSPHKELDERLGTHIYPGCTSRAPGEPAPAGPQQAEAVHTMDVDAPVAH
ncbi:MAG: hypothetical protein Q9196_005556, partial [Gyalolechia fulgens]